MKSLLNRAMRFTNKLFGPIHTISTAAGLFLWSIIFAAIFFPSCQKPSNEIVSPTFTSDARLVSTDNPNASEVMNMYSGLSSKTVWELQQARAATARYRDLKNAIKDGYTNINVDVPNMGHHFMKSSLVDGVFDIRHPEILVYNGIETGHPELVAVEYAVPLTDPMPEGFTGSTDVWNGTSGFPLWLVHAWVWKYNPDGVFNWTNQAVDLD
ncbi:MAG: hypothetical protein KGM16_12585 [Bacteroidota bacterium]|nr:hypothetical protein [Bacteroidota bacterium]